MRTKAVSANIIVGQQDPVADKATDHKMTNPPPQDDEDCPFGEMTPEEIDEFNADSEEVEREVGQDHYRPYTGQTVDDLKDWVEKNVTEGKPVAD